MSWLILFLPLFVFASVDSLFEDLEKLQAIDKKHQDCLPFFYNQTLMGGYFTAPSARMGDEGAIALGGSFTSRSASYGANLQLFRRFELSGDYLTFDRDLKSWLHKNQEKRLHAKWLFYSPADGWRALPLLALGEEEFVAKHHRTVPYVVATKEWLAENIELSLGYRMKNGYGLFGGGIWTPFRKRNWLFVKDLSLIGEYDLSEEGEKKKSLHWGLGYLGGNCLQLAVATTTKGEALATASLRYPLGTTKGFLPKTKDPSFYKASSEAKPEDQELADHFVEAFRRQGLPIFTFRLAYDDKQQKGLWISMVNERYREERVVWERLLYLLSGLMPPEMAWVDVAIEAEGIPAYSYHFQRTDLALFAKGERTKQEMSTISPRKEVMGPPQSDSSLTLYHREKPMALFTFRPRLITFFQGEEGTFAYNAALLGASEGYLFDQLFYRAQAGFSCAATKPIHDDSHTLFNPKPLVEIRTDLLRYYQAGRFTLEELYLQKGWKIDRGLYARVSGGLFEISFGGIAGEILFYPVDNCFGIGLDGAAVLKRSYNGLAFKRKVDKLAHGEIEREIFIGAQAFLSLYGYHPTMRIDGKLSVGQFLAKDLGSRLELGKSFKSGFRFSLWYTLSSLHGLHGHPYQDRGFSFAFPLDFFMRSSSKEMMGYALSTELKNNGVISSTGKPLFQTLERR